MGTVGATPGRNDEQRGRVRSSTLQTDFEPGVADLRRTRTDHRNSVLTGTPVTEEGLVPEGPRRLQKGVGSGPRDERKVEVAIAVEVVPVVLLGRRRSRNQDLGWTEVQAAVPERDHDLGVLTSDEIGARGIEKSVSVEVDHAEHDRHSSR